MAGVDESAEGGAADMKPGLHSSQKFDDDDDDFDNEEEAEEEFEAHRAAGLENVEKLFGRRTEVVEFELEARDVRVGPAP